MGFAPRNAALRLSFTKGSAQRCSPRSRSTLIAPFCCPKNGEYRNLQRWKFYWWRRRLRENQASSDRPSISEEGFVELLGSSDRTEDGSSGITVKLDGRLSILLDRGFDPSTLKQVLSVVSERL